MRPDFVADPIRTDEHNPFAHHTMKVRVPGVIEDILKRNPDYPAIIAESLKRLAEDIQANAVIAPIPPFAPDYDHWSPALRQYQGSRWLATVWFFAEVYFYRRVIDAVRWWETNRDPFLPNKTEEYAGDTPWALLAETFAAGEPHEERLAAALHRALWGNRIDLSFAASRAHGTIVSEGDLLHDDTHAVIESLMQAAGDVHMVADNAGTELLMDMALIDTLLAVPSMRVTLHLKMHPTFVSDATSSDVWQLWGLLTAKGGTFASLAARLTAAFEGGRLRLLPHFFWNSPYFLWDAPAGLMTSFRNARLVIVKGDANYRRIVGDAVWPPETPFDQVMAYFPAPLVALRTLKSDPIVGLAAGLAQRLDLLDERWRVNGKRGVIQFRPA